jgi:murein DD-endopeptidase MepM/ murein hydrolase activator NlpD
MSNDPTTETEDARDEAQDEAAPKKDPRAKMRFLGKVEDDRWEGWAFSAVGLAATALVVWGVAFARLGTPSVHAYSVGIPLTYFMSIPIVLWGLVKSMLNPPVLRLSRSVAFVAITLVALAANNPLFDAPVSTSELDPSYTLELPLSSPDAQLYVLNGGASGERNAYATSMPLRYATSFTLLRDGREHPEGSDALEDHYCFGQPVLSPADATVSQVYDGTPDHPIDEVEVQSPFGNFIVLALPDGHALVLSFLKKDSALVKKGDAVTAGQPLAACGNSGPAPTPRVRVHVQNSNSDDPQRFLLSEGVPAPYRYVDPATGELVPRGLPRGGTEPGDLTSGQVVANP